MQKILSFIRDLQASNCREWFQENRDRYELARKEFLDFVDNIIHRLGLMDPDLGTVDARHAIFRINRDIRFSKDKSPYKTNFGAFIVKGGKKSGNAGYYLHLEPGRSFAGGGVYHPRPEVLKKVRWEIYENTGEFLEIIGNRDFKEYYGGLWETDMLKTAPRDFPKDFKHIDLLRHRNYVVTRPFDDTLVQSGRLEEETLKAFRLMVPFIFFLNFALEH